MTIGSCDWNPENFDYDTELECGCESKTIYIRCVDCELCLQCCRCEDEKEV